VFLLVATVQELLVPVVLVAQLVPMQACWGAVLSAPDVEERQRLEQDHVVWLPPLPLKLPP